MGLHLKRNHPNEIGTVSSEKEEIILTKFFVTSSVPFNVLHNRWFKEIMQRIMSVVSPQTISRNIVAMAVSVKRELIESMRKVDHMSLVADAWKTPFGQHIFGIGGTYLTEEFDIVEIPLFVKVVNTSSGHTDGDYISKAIAQVTGKDQTESCIGLDIAEKVASITVDGGSDLRRGARLANIPKIYCLNHILSLAVEEFLNSSTVSTLFEKCRRIAEWYKRSNASLENYLKEEEIFQPLRGNRPRSIHSYSKTRWLTASQLLSSITFNIRSIDGMLRDRKRQDLIIEESLHSLLFKCTIFMDYLNDVQLFVETSETASFANLHPLYMRIESFVHDEISTTEDLRYQQGLHFFKCAFESRFVRQYSTEATQIALMLHPLHKSLSHLDLLKKFGTPQSGVDAIKAKILELFNNAYREWVEQNVRDVDSQRDRSSFVNPITSGYLGNLDGQSLLHKWPK